MEKDKKKKKELQSMATFPLIWIDSRAFFWILILIVRHCDSRGVLTIRLLHYQNEYGQTFDGHCCDHRPTLKVPQSQNCGVQCDYVLRLLITGLGRANEHVFRFRRPIKYNANNIKFEDSTAELTIPFSSWPGEAGLLVFFYDYDDADDSARLVDWFQTRLTQDKVHPGKVAYKELYGNRKLHKTRLQFDWSVRSKDSFKNTDLSNPFPIPSVGERRLVRKIQNAEYDQIKNVPVHHPPVTPRTSNSSSPLTSTKKAPMIQTLKGLSQNTNDHVFTASTIVVSWRKLQKPINEVKRLTSKILSQSGSTDFIDNMPVVRQKKTDSFGNKTVSRSIWRTSHETPIVIGQFSTLSPSNQPMDNSRVSLPDSSSVRNTTFIKKFKEIKAKHVTTSAKTGVEFDENNSFTFGQAPSVVVTKWQKPLHNGRRQVIKTAAAAASPTSSRFWNKTRRGSDFHENTERGSNSRAVGDSRFSEKEEVKTSQINKNISRFDEEIIKDVQLRENADIKSHNNEEMEKPQKDDMNLKFKNPDSRKQISRIVPSEKLVTVGDSKSRQEIEDNFQLEENERQSEGDTYDSEIITRDFTNNLTAINKKRSTALPRDSNLSHTEESPDLTHDTVTVHVIKSQISDKKEWLLSNVTNPPGLILDKNERRNKFENEQKRSSSEQDLEIPIEENHYGSGAVDIEFEETSNTNTMFPYVSVGAITSLGIGSDNRTSPALHEEESTNSSFKTRLISDRTFSYNLHHGVPSLIGGQQTTAKASQTESFRISSRLPPTTFINRLSLQQESGSNIETELLTKTANVTNVLTPSLNEIINENPTSVLKKEKGHKVKHVSNSDHDVDQTSTENDLNTTSSNRQDILHSYTIDKSTRRNVANSTSTSSTKSREKNWQRTNIREAASNDLKTTDYYVIDKTPINSVASRREKDNGNSYGKKREQHDQKAKGETENNNESIVPINNGLKNNGDGIKEERLTQLLESDSPKNRYSPGQIPVPGNEENGISKLSDGERMSEDQGDSDRKRNTKTRLWQKNSGKSGINKTDVLYDHRYLTVSSSGELNREKTDNIVQGENSKIRNNQEANKQWFSLRQVVNPGTSKKHRSKKIRRKIKTDSGITEPEPLDTISNELTDNMTSILLSLSGSENNITTKNTFPQKEVSTNEGISVVEGYTTRKENINESNHSKDFLKNLNQTVTSKQSDKKVLKENNHDSKNGKTRTGDFREVVQSKTKSTTTPYNENRMIEQKKNPAMISSKSIDISLSNRKKTIDGRENADLTIIDLFVTQSNADGLESTEKRFKNPRHETDSIKGDDMKTVIIPTKEISIKESKFRTHTPRQIASTSNPSSVGKSGERTPIKLPQRQGLDKSKYLRSEVEIKMADVTVDARKTTSTDMSTKTTIIDSKNPSISTESYTRQNISLMSTRENSLAVELTPEISLESSPSDDSENNYFSHENKDIETKGITFANIITDDRYTKINEKDLQKDERKGKGLQFENYYEDRFGASRSPVLSFSNTHSIFLSSPTTDSKLSPSFDSTRRTGSNSAQRTEGEVRTTESPSSKEYFQFKANNLTDSMSTNPPRTTRLYKELNEDKLVLNTIKRNQNPDDDAQVVTTRHSSNNTFDSSFTKWADDVSEVTKNESHKEVLNTPHSPSVFKTTEIRNQATVSLQFPQENQNSSSTMIEMNTSESIKVESSTPLSIKNKVTMDKQSKFDKNLNRINQTRTELSLLSTRGLKARVLTSTQGYPKKTLPKWIIFPRNFEDFLKYSNRKPNVEHKQAMPATKSPPSFKRNEMNPKVAAGDKLVSTWATSPTNFNPRRSTVYLKEKRLYRPSAASLPQHQPKLTNQVQMPKNITERIINNTRDAVNRNLLQDNPLKEDWNFQSILGIREAFEKYWPAILGSTFGVLFLGAAILTSFMCKRSDFPIVSSRRTRFRRRRIRGTPRDQCYSPQPPVSDYSSGSSLIGENCPVSETPTSLEGIS